jgi:hypothetical protein
LALLLTACAMSWRTANRDATMSPARLPS